jgi:hypothetical protein
MKKLQDEAKKYGFRPSLDRKILLKQLKEVQEALERQKEDEEDSVIGDTSMHSSSSFMCPSSLDHLEGEVSMSEFTMEVIKQAKEHPADVQSIESDSDRGCDDDDSSEDSDEDKSLMSLAQARAQSSTTSPTEIAPSLSTQLYKAITSDKALYHRILLFEPVSFDEVSSTAKRAGVTGLKNKEILRNWLDMQGICFYSAELSGPRHRH